MPHRRAVEQLNGKRLVVRTLDIGGDKPLQFMPLPKEMNPFLWLPGYSDCA